MKKVDDIWLFLLLAHKLIGSVKTRDACLLTILDFLVPELCTTTTKLE